jgi:hypothetical protein
MLWQLIAALLLLAAQTPSRTFEGEPAGQPPAGFSFAAGRNASAGRWTIQRDGGNQAVLHSGVAAEADGFSVAVYQQAKFESADISVKVKASGGSRACGLVWRYQDALNHYVVQLNLSRQELAMYRVVRGNRIRIEREDDLELDPGAWHTLRIVQDDESIRVYLGGIRVFGDRDRAVSGPGSVGLWASGDADVSFDDFRAEARPERRRETSGR